MLFLNEISVVCLVGFYGYIMLSSFFILNSCFFEGSGNILLDGYAV